MMTMEEYINDLKTQISKEYEYLKNVHSDDKLESDELADAGVELQNLFSTFEKYKSINYLTQKQMTSIRTLFSSFDEYGGIVGFIDTSLMFQNGKTGVLFQQSGMASRSMGGSSDTKITYKDLCRSVIVPNNDYLVASYKFKYQKQEYGMNMIKAADKIQQMMFQIRDRLLQNNPQARSVFYKCYSAILDYVKESIDSNVANALTGAEMLCSFCKSFPIENYYIAPLQLVIILNVMNHDFDAAKKYAEQNNLYNWLKFIDKKRIVFHEILAKQFYDSATEKYHNNDFENAKKLILDSLQEKSTEEAWQLYVDIIYQSANEKNFYNRQLLNELLNGMEVKPEQQKAIDSNQDKFEELKTKIDEYIKKLRRQIPEKVIANDIDFFKNNKSELIDYVDENNMNSLMYAAFYHKTELFNLLKKQGYNTSLKAFELYSCYELYSLLCKNWEDYFKTVGTIDLEAKSLNEKCNQAIEKAKSDLNGEKAWGAIVGAASLVTGSQDWVMREFGGYEDSIFSDAHKGASKLSSNASDDIQSAERVLKEVRKECDKIRKKYFKDVHNYIMREIENCFFLEEIPKEDIPKWIEIPEDADYKEYFKVVGIFESLLNDRVQLLAEKRCNEIPPKSEFETTEQFKIRVDKSVKELFYASIRPAYFDLKKDFEIIEKSKPVIAQIISKIFESQEYVKIGSYNADEQCFSANWNGFLHKIEFKIAIPIADAPEFKKRYIESGVPVQVLNISSIEHGLAVICKAESNGKTYQYQLYQK